MKLTSIGLVVSEKTMFKYVDGTPIWATLAEIHKLMSLTFVLCFHSNALFQRERMT